MNAPKTPAPRAGTATLFGWTNVGKSTLLNRLVGDKLAAVADVSQTTRHRITGIRNVAQRGQIVFVDTPGMHRPRSRMNRAMLEELRQGVSVVDLAVLVVDASAGLGGGDRQVAELLERSGRPRLMALNKIDCVRPKSRLLPMLREAVEGWGFPDAVPVSARTGEGCERLVDCVLERLPESAPLYPPDYWTDQTERSLAAEWIREKLLALTREELPHAMAVLIERWVEREDGLVEIAATILVDRASQRQIVIGRGGELLKQVGVAARTELERLLERRVFLRLWVKVRQDWRNDEKTLRELGFH